MAIIGEICKNKKKLFQVSKEIFVKYSEIISDEIKAICAKSKIKVIWICVSLIFWINFENNHQINNHHIIHHKSIQLKIQIQVKKLWALKIQVCTISNIIKNNAIEVASFIKDSHSKIYAILFGTQSSLKIAITAIGSVADIIAQNKSDKSSGISIQNKNESQNFSEKAIIVVEIISQKIANDIIGIASFTIFLYGILYALSNIKIGRKI